MSKLKFDKNGNLATISTLLLNMTDYHESFVTNFSNSETRPELFNKQVLYNNKLQKITNNELGQYVVGSFITTKLNPSDIDVLNTLPFDVYNMVHESVDKLITQKSSVKFQNAIHSFLVFRSDPKDPLHTLFQKDYDKWLEFFSKDKDSNKKGLIEIKVENHEKI